MNSRWSKYSAPKGSSGGGLFVSLRDGERMEFMVGSWSEPHERYRVWDAAARTYTEVDGPSVDAKPQILLPVYDVEQRSVRILPMAVSTWVDLVAALEHPRVGGEDQIYEISRTGAGKDTRWRVQRLDKADAKLLDVVSREQAPDMMPGRPLIMAASSPPKDDPQPSAEPDAEDAPDDEIPF